LYHTVELKSSLDKYNGRKNMDTSSILILVLFVVVIAYSVYNQIKDKKPPTPDSLPNPGGSSYPKNNPPVEK